MSPRKSRSANSPRITARIRSPSYTARGTNRALNVWVSAVVIRAKGVYLNLMVVRRFQLFRVGIFGSWVVGANMRCKLLVAAQLEVAHHFIEGCAGGRTGRFEPPATFGATKPPKARLLNPYHLPPHGRPSRCAPASTRWLSRDTTFWFAISGPFRSGVQPGCSRKPLPSLAVTEYA